MAEIVSINPPIPSFNFTYGVNGKEHCMLLGTWDERIPLTGYHVSEKMDGIRCIWTGDKFITREGNQIHAPHWFTSGLPAYALDGELWMGRGIAMFDRINGLIKGNHWNQPKQDSPWLQVKYMIFDVPVLNVPFERRREVFLRQQRRRFGEHAFLVRSVPIKDRTHFNELCEKVRGEGGEGLVARKPNSLYVFRRSDDVLKIKFWNKGVAQIQKVGRKTCSCYTDEGIEIFLPIRDAVIDKLFVFKCLGRTSGDIPRFPTFVSFDIPDSLPPIPPAFKGEFTTRVPKMLGWESGKLDKEEPVTVVHPPVYLYNDTLTPLDDSIPGTPNAYDEPLEPATQFADDDESMEEEKEEEEEMKLYFESDEEDEDATAFEEAAYRLFDHMGV